MVISSFNAATMKYIKKYYHTNTSHVIAYIMFYDINKVIIYKVWGEMIYILYDSFISLDYLCIHQYRLSKQYNFSKTLL